MPRRIEKMIKERRCSWRRGGEGRLLHRIKHITSRVLEREKSAVRFDLLNYQVETYII